MTDQPEALTAEKDRDLVVLNHHVPNCPCEVSDQGRVVLSEVCSGWTKIMQRFIEDQKASVLRAAADAVPSFEFMLLDPTVAEVAPAQIGAWLRATPPGAGSPPDHQDFGDPCPHRPAWDAVATHTRTANGIGPDHCAECSAAIKEWVQWPCARACPCGCSTEMHVGEIGCPCVLPGEPPCVPISRPGQTADPSEPPP